MSTWVDHQAVQKGAGIQAWDHNNVDVRVDRVVQNLNQVEVDHHWWVDLRIRVVLAIFGVEDRKKGDNY